MSGGGYATSSEAMMRAQVRLEEAAKEPAAHAKKVAPPEVTEADFGDIHGQFFSAYESAITEIAEAMKGFSAELGGLGGNVGAAGQRYSATEEASAADAADAGRGI